jgi:hypothetical protein
MATGRKNWKGWHWPFGIMVWNKPSIKHWRSSDSSPSCQLRSKELKCHGITRVFSFSSRGGRRRKWSAGCFWSTS